MDGPRVFQVLRIPALLVLLAVAVSAKPPLVQALTRLEFDVLWSPWLTLMAAGLAFVCVALWDRHRRHPAWVLGLEGLIAAVIGLMPPMAWIMWFGVGHFASFGAATGNLFAQALALAWLGVVIATAVRQARRRQPEASDRAGAEAVSATGKP